MESNTRYIRLFLCMIVALLCFMACRVGTVSDDNTSLLTTKVESSICESSDIPNASLEEKEDDMLRAVREMGKWGIPSASITLQGATGRVPAISKAMQRISRQLNVLLMGDLSNRNGFAGTLYHTLSSKRFHSGYYIYYRCQMRC